MIKKLFPLAALLLLVASCTNAIDNVENLRLRAGADSNLPVFYATIEGSGNAATKVFADDQLRVLWNADDRITVFNKYSYGYEYSFTGQDGDNAGEFAAVPNNSVVTGNALDHVYAVYPHNSATKISNDGVITATLPSQQAYKANSFGIGANTMMSVTDDTQLRFKNVGGYLSFKFYGNNVSVKRITLKGNNHEKLAGKASITMALGGTPTVEMQEDATESITLTCETPVTVGTTAENPTEFWFVLPPTTFMKGFTITITDSQGGIFEKSTSGCVTISRNNLSRMSPMEVIPVTNVVPPDNEIWYTTSSGRIINASVERFGANLISNTYVNGKGIMAFDGPVTQVPAHAFENFMDDESASLLTISFPHSLKTIGGCAFYRTHKLQRVDLPENLEYIGDQAFFYTALKELHLPDHVEFDGNISVCNSEMQAFYSKYASEDHRCLIKDGTLLSFAPAGLTEYEVPEGITRLCHRCFAEMPELSEVKMPNSLRVIEGQAFDGSGLIHVEVPEGVVGIGDWAFRGNAKLETISFPNSLQELGQTVVGMCPNLTAFQGKFSSSDGKCLVVDGELLSFAQKGVLEYTIPSGVSVIGEDVFWANSIIQNLTVSEGVKEIKRGAFYACSSLKNIYLPASLEKIGSRILTASSLQAILGPHASADGKCFIFKGKLVTIATSGLTTYVIPEGVKEIGAEAVLDSELEELYIPEGVETIDENAFRICPRLKILSIPSTVTSIGNVDNSQHELFYYCPVLSRVLLKAKTPPALLCPILGNSTIYVYNDAMKCYLQDSEWSKYTISGVDSFEKQDDLYESTDYSQDGKTIVLQKATKGAGIDVFILGDAFSDRQIASGRYESVMRTAYAHLFSEEPYKSCQECFNVYMVYAVSKNEVYSLYSETALGTYFGEGTFIGGNTDMVWNYVYRTPLVSFNNTLAVVVLNSDRYAGTCHMYYDYEGCDYGCGDAIAYCPLSATDDLFREVLLHEAFGHGFAKLDDEYGGGTAITETDIQWKYESPHRGGWYKNVDITDNPLTIKWKDFLSDARYQGEGIGVFEGAGTFAFGAWRPTEESIMRMSGGFNAPSRYAIWYRIGKLAYGESWKGSYEDFVAYDAVNHTPAASARRMAQRRHYIEKPLPPLASPVVVGHSWREALERR